MNRGKKPAHIGSGSPVRKGGEDVTDGVSAAPSPCHWPLRYLSGIGAARPTYADHPNRCLAAAPGVSRARKERRDPRTIP